MQGAGLSFAKTQIPFKTLKENSDPIFFKGSNVQNFKQLILLKISFLNLVF